MKKAIVSSLSFLLAVTSFMINAEEQQPKKLENVQFLSITYTDFKPEKTNKAMEIIKNHYFPASKKAGTQVPHVVRFHSGEWDIATIWDLKKGYSSMEWEVNEEGIKWINALNKQEGKEKSKEIRDEFNSLIQRSNQEIGYHSTDIK